MSEFTRDSLLKDMETICARPLSIDAIETRAKWRQYFQEQRMNDVMLKETIGAYSDGVKAEDGFALQLNAFAWVATLKHTGRTCYWHPIRMKVRDILIMLPDEEFYRYRHPCSVKCKTLNED